MTTKLRMVALALIAVVVLPVVSFAQDEGEFDPKKAVKEIKEDLDSVLEDLSSLNGGEVDPEKGKDIVNQMDELLKQMKGSQSRIVDNIDNLIKNMKKNPSGSPSQGEQDKKKKDQKKKEQEKRDRNEKPKDGERDEPKDQKGNKPQGEQKPDGQDPQKDPKQGKQKKKAPESGVKKVPVTQDSENWGNLPAETRQLLIEKNFRDYFPDYHKEINDYLKSLKRKQ
ncbi:MAG: hypothetical protein ACI97A_002275 [Planctomycetota bacterium]|jgi:hypothetical protein